MKKIIRNLRNLINLINLINLRTWLIHKLGGITKEEINTKTWNAYMKGEYIALDRLRTYAESLYGLPAEEWCKSVYFRMVNYYKVNKL